MDIGWDPSIDIEDALEQLPDCNISFSEYTRQIGDGFEATNSSASVTTVDPICRLDLASMIAPLKPNKIGVLKPANDDEKGDEREITYWLRVSGQEADRTNLKLNSKNTNKMIPIAGGKQAVSGVNNMFVDDDFFKLKAHPSQLLPFPKVSELQTNTDIVTHPANEYVMESIIRSNNDKNDIQNPIITMSSTNESDFSKLDDSCKDAAEDTTQFYTPRQIYNMKKKRSQTSKKADLPQNGF